MNDILSSLLFQSCLHAGWRKWTYLRRVLGALCSLHVVNACIRLEKRITLHSSRDRDSNITRTFLGFKAMVGLFRRAVQPVFCVKLCCSSKNFPLRDHLSFDVLDARQNAVSNTQWSRLWPASIRGGRETWGAGFTNSELVFQVVAAG